MKTYSDVCDVNKEINSYVEHFTGAPLLVGVDNSEDYRALIDALSADSNKQILRMSDSCTIEFPPKPNFYVLLASNAAKIKPVIWLGAAQAIMLYGQQEIERFFIDIAGTSVKGPLVVLCPYCCGVLDTIARNYVKLGRCVVSLHNKDRDIPSICIHENEMSCTSNHFVKGIKGLIGTLEDGCSNDIIHVVTTCDKKHLMSSVFPVVESISAYKVVCSKEPGLAVGTIESNGTEQQWLTLSKRIAETGSLAKLCEDALCAVGQLDTEFPDHYEGTADDRFLCFVTLKAFYSAKKDYLAACLAKCNVADDLLECIYFTILDFGPDDPRLSTMLRQRRRILQAFEENSVLIKDYCDKATVWGRNVIRYLSDNTEEERAAIIHALCAYDYTPSEMISMLREVAPDIALYLQEFTFSSYNTKTLEADSPVRQLLTDYFQQYKIQKITNRQEPSFVAVVEEEAHKRSFTKLQARSAIIKKLDKRDSQPYFFDALGVEFLAYIEAKADQYGMQFECQIGRCNLPSITSKNKEFYDAFPSGTIRKEDGIDQLKHHGTKYDYRITSEPLHLFEELSILDHELKKMSKALAAEKVKKVIILSDHGASRFAVTYQSENDKLALAEPGQHSGRCCPADADPMIPFVTYEDGFAILANYDRFKGSRKADVEAHGGATLEEVIVPVIILTAKAKEQQVFFPEHAVKCSAKEGASIMLYANPPLHTPRLVIAGNSYDGVFDGDKHNMRFVMPDIRRKGTYSADVYDGDKKLETLEFETKRSTATNDLF